MLVLLRTTKIWKSKEKLLKWEGGPFGQCELPQQLEYLARKTRTLNCKNERAGIANDV